MRIAAYCRVSTDKEEQLDSLEHQKSFFQEYAEKNGYELFRIYPDEGISGRALKNRREFLRMMDDADRGLFDMIVVKDISRFARNTVDALTAVRRLRSLGIEVTFLSNNMTILGQSEFVLTVFSALAQEESANLSKRVKFGKRVTGKKGRTPTVIYGYDHVDNLHLTVNEAEAQVVRDIFTQYTREGMGCRKIAMELNARGIPTKKGALWNARGVRRILGNSIYCGEYVNHKYEISDFLEGRLVRTPESEHLLHERPEWAIVSKELFRQTQRQIALRQKNTSGGQSRYSSRHLFSTLIRCGRCGRAYCRRGSSVSGACWRCPTNSQYTAAGCPNNAAVREEALLTCLREYLARQIGEEAAFTEEILTSFTEAWAADRQNCRGELERRRSRLQYRREKLQRMYESDMISLEELRERLRPVARELEEVAEGLTVTDRPAWSGEETEALRQEVRRFLSLETMTNVQLRTLLQTVTAERDGSVRICFRELPAVIL